MKRILLVMCTSSAILLAPAARAHNTSTNRTDFFQQQDKTVKGKVTDENGIPVADATVAVKDKRIVTTTREDGTFSIQVPAGSNTITVTHIGMTDQEIDLSGKTDISVTMYTTGESMDDVVVIGYGSEKRSRINGAIATVNMKEVEDLPVGNLGAALAGRILGVGVSGGTGRPGVPASLTVRNPLTLSKDGGNNNPLIVIDDVIQVDAQGANTTTLFDNLDPSEVESITFLKDAAAAIYGSRGANGAVIVRTKRGKSGAPRVTYSGSYATNDETYRTKMMSAFELARYINIANGPNGAAVGDPNDRSRFFSDDELEHFKTINHDWLDPVWKPSYNMRHTLNVSGGADRATYFAGITYYTQDGNIGELDYGKWTYRAGTDINIATGLKAGIQVAGVQQTQTRMNSKIGGESIEKDYQIMLRAPRYVPTYIDGLPVKLPGSFGNNSSGYHFQELTRLGNFLDDKQDIMTANIFLEYQVPFIDGLKVRGSYGRNSSTSRTGAIGTRYPLYLFTDMMGDNGHIYEGATNPQEGIAQNDNRIRFSNVSSRLYQANFTVNYNKQFGDHSIGAFISGERSESESNQDDAWKENPALSTNGQFSTAFGAIDGRTFAYESGNLGYVGRVNYGFANRYTANFMFRSDASTRFAPENYWGKFYSIGLGWAISEEKFYKVDWMNYLKIRYSFGKLGKDDIKPWGWRQRYTFQNGKGGVFGPDNTPAGIGMKMEASPNRNATWSDDYKNNVGIDARFFDSRLSLTLEGFYNKGRNLLIARTGNVPITVGGSVASQNYANVDFFGYEIALGWDGRIGQDFSYGIQTRFAWSDNKVLQGDFNDTDILYPWNAQPGRSNDNGVWGYDYIGMFRNQADIDAYVQKFGITQMFNYQASQFRPGMLYYTDVRGPLQEDGSFAGPDGIIDNNDQVLLHRRQSSQYGFGTTFRAAYKGIALDFVVAGSFGGWSEMDARSTLERNINNLYQNGPSYWGDAFDPDLNPTGYFPNPFHSSLNTIPSAFWQVSGFRARIVNANLNYSLPRSVANAIKMNSARVVLTALNPVTLFNPYSYRGAEGAWDTYPVLRTISLGVNLSF